MHVFYNQDPVFGRLYHLRSSDTDLLHFIVLNRFDPNALWAPENPVIHCWLANEMFDDVRRLLQLIPEHINPNLCDGEMYGRKSLLILLTVLPSSGRLFFEFNEKYKGVVDLDYQDKEGRTAMHYAVILGRYEVYKALVECGATITILDNLNKQPLDYLGCEETLITHTLKSIDIDPERDMHARRNKICDHHGNLIMLQGAYLVQKKSCIGRLVAESQLQFTKYINGRPLGWGRFIGDTSPATYDDMLAFAKRIARKQQIPLDDVFTGEVMDEEYHEQLIGLFRAQQLDFAGISVLERCIEGHGVIAEELHLSIDTVELQNLGGKGQVG